MTNRMTLKTRMVAIGQNEAKPEDPDSILLKDPDRSGISPAWTTRDGGGNSDCGYRSSALSLAQSQNKALSSSGIAREAANLRVLTVRKLEKHFKFKDKWAPDLLEKPNEAIGMTEPAQTFQEYISWFAKQGYWIDGLQWQSLSGET